MTELNDTIDWSYLICSRISLQNDCEDMQQDGKNTAYK